MSIRPFLLSFVHAVGLAFDMPAPHARDLDLHAFWDQRCHECHGHAGAFAREMLTTRDGGLVGRHHTDDLRLFLGQHYMSEPMAGRIHAMLLAQAATKPVYRQHCAGCHRTAAELVRNDVDVAGGALVGRKGRRPLSQFLLRHAGGLDGGDLATILESFQRIRAETSGQPIPKPETKQ